MSSTVDVNLSYLQADLARIDVLIRCYAQRRQLAEPPSASAGLAAMLPDEELNAILRAPLGSAWAIHPNTIGDALFIPPGLERAGLTEYVEAMAQEYMHIAQQAQNVMQQAQQTGFTLRVPHLEQVFGLDAFEMNALLLVLAATLDHRYARLYAYFLDDMTLQHPTVGLLLDILCPPGLSRLTQLAHFGDDSPLIKYQLLELELDGGTPSAPLLQRSVGVPHCIVAWLFGDYRPHPVLGIHARLEQHMPDATHDLLAAEAWPQLVQSMHGQSYICFYGPDEGAQAAVAVKLAAVHGRPLLTVDLAAVLRQGVAPLTAVRMALRDARLTGAILHLEHIDAAVEDGVLLAGLQAELSAYADLVVLSGAARWRMPAMANLYHSLWLEFKPPTYEQRLRLWRHFLGASPLPDKELEALTAQIELRGSQIRSVVATAANATFQRGADPQSDIQAADLWAAVRLHTSSGLDTLAYKIAPRYGWGDLVVSDEQIAVLREVAAMVRQRHKVLEEWGVGQKLMPSSAVTVLFAGEPGTGKTMAAEVLAKELGLDLYKIDLSSMVSKYIGETEKNLERIFSEAERTNAILFFDEADALFGKRTGVQDSHDRYANISVSYLLQRMEIYDGVTILATNLRANLDEAFTRRLQFSVDFPFPDAAERLRIWQTLLPSNLPLAGNLDLDYLAHRFKLAGGNIRNAIVSAAYLAAEHSDRVTMEDLLHGVRRELQKLGHLVPDADMHAPATGATAKRQPGEPQNDDPANQKFYRVRRR